MRARDWWPLLAGSPVTRSRQSSSKRSTSCARRPPARWQRRTRWPWPDLEDDLSEWLTGHNVDREWMIAPVLAAAGVGTGWCDRATVILDGPALEPGLEWVASALSADMLLAEIKESSQRISALVGAVKSYTQMDRSSMQRIDVTEGLESTPHHCRTARWNHRDRFPPRSHGSPGPDPGPGSCPMKLTRC
jgi:hypothetical protein